VSILSHLHCESGNISETVQVSDVDNETQKLYAADDVLKSGNKNASINNKKRKFKHSVNGDRPQTQKKIIKDDMTQHQSIV